jgi:hypothetical protein
MPQHSLLEAASKKHGPVIKLPSVENKRLLHWGIVSSVQAVFGTIPNVKGKGRAASHVADLMARMRREQPLPRINPEIDTLILLDRQVDMITPMCSQLTYEGLLDEVSHLRSSLNHWG